MNGDSVAEHVLTFSEADSTCSSDSFVVLESSDEDSGTDWITPEDSKEQYHEFGPIHPSPNDCPSNFHMPLPPFAYGPPELDPQANHCPATADSISEHPLARSEPPVPAPPSVSPPLPPLSAVPSPVPPSVPTPCPKLTLVPAQVAEPATHVPLPEPLFWKASKLEESPQMQQSPPQMLQAKPDHVCIQMDNLKTKPSRALHKSARPLPLMVGIVLLCSLAICMPLGLKLARVMPEHNSTDGRSQELPFAAAKVVDLPSSAQLLNNLRDEDSSETHLISLSDNHPSSKNKPHREVAELRMLESLPDSGLTETDDAEEENAPLIELDDESVEVDTRTPEVTVLEKELQNGVKELQEHNLLPLFTRKEAKKVIDWVRLIPKNMPDISML